MLCVLWFCEVYRDVIGIGRMMFFIVCKFVIEKMFGKLIVAVLAFRAVSWVIIRDLWNEGGVG